ncbi:DUF6279 family lipoprotein [Vibrio sp. Of7-15]|uniref:DUF6279 family lipoprotein n=1 Tax=Vibrio sp. Of7-15 TaxID=2724879 RepID=UPI001EF1EC3F|nr:DUF6279 family lipoprotein [Vibrio sp. Of7-15]MCG7497098.1 DUF6279 family lipoprotein [Vibrio sp. Of7-15]
MKRSARLLIVLFSVFLLSACTLKLIYKTLPFWAGYYLADYVDLNSSQEKALDEDLEQFFTWHRENALPPLANLVAELRQDLKEPLNYQQIQGYYHKFNHWGFDSIRQASHVVSNMLISLDEEQINQLETNLIQKSEKKMVERTVLPTSRKVKQRQGHLIDRTEEWIGKTSDKQRRILKELASYQIEFEPSLYSIRSQLISDVQRLISLRHTDEQFGHKVGELLVNWADIGASKYDLNTALLLNRRFEVMLRLNHSLSDKQRLHLDKELRALESELQGIIQN